MVLDAQRSLHASEDDWVQSQTNVVVALVSLYKSLGGGWNLDPPPPAVASLAER